MKMWQIILLFLYFVGSQVTSHNIKVTCKEFIYMGFPQTNVTASPSKMAALKLQLLTEGEEVKLNISWAINIDASVTCLTGTHVEISGEPTHLCKYDPPFSQANLTGLEQVWFNFILPADFGFYFIEVYNVPLSPVEGGNFRLIERIDVRHRPKPTTTKTTAYVTDEYHAEPTLSVETSAKPTLPAPSGDNVVIIIIGVLAALVLLGSFCILYKSCRPVHASYLGIQNMPAPAVVDVPVLVVYPAVNSAFQHAVVALAEFLQLHCSCKVAIDMWQQGKVAELGPLRWLAEQVNAADHVLIITPQRESPSSLLHSSPNLPEHSIPAAARDLYPLILNMVASNAKNTSDLSKFCVVHLNRKSCVFLPELKSCKSFYLIKDLKRLCKTLHRGRKVEKMMSISYSKNSVVKLEEAIKMLERGRPGVSSEILIDHLQSKC